MLNTRHRKVLLATVLIACFFSAESIAQLQDSTRLYSLLSACNITVSGSGNNAHVEIDRQQYTAKLQRDPYSAEYIRVTAGKAVLFLMALTDDTPYILNDKYQQGCESSKLILLHDPADDSSPAAFRNYLDDTQYILDDSSRVLRKAEFMRSHGWMEHTTILLEALIAKHPHQTTAYLLLADTYHDMKGDKVKVKAAYDSYCRNLQLRDGGSVIPEARPY